MNAIFGKPLPANITGKLKFAEGIRDNILHGKGVSQPEARQASVDVLDYATEFNTFVGGIAGFHPFGGMRGFKGRKQSYDKPTTRLVLKGLGL